MIAQDIVGLIVTGYSIARLVSIELDRYISDSEILSARSWPVDISFIPDIYDLDDEEINWEVVEFLNETFGEDN